MFNSIVSDNPAAWQIIVCLIVTVAMGFVFSTLYCFIRKEDGYSKDTAITYVVLPIVICALALVITYAMTTFTDSLTVARYGRVLVALLAVFVMIKFRSQQKTLEELTYIFFLTAAGLCNGLGYVVFGTVLYGVVVAVVSILHFIKFPFSDKRSLSIKITIPEDLNFENAFTDVMAQYTDKNVLRKVKTKDMGTMFLLTYYVHMKRGASVKEFTDRLREINGNLDICVTAAVSKGDGID